MLRGRQRTRVERLASWRVGDRGRGWASVWALHDNAVGPHRSYAVTPSRRVSCRNTHLLFFSTYYEWPPPCAPVGAARRRGSPDEGGGRLAVAWRTDPHSPPWARRHSVHAWAAVLAAPAAHRWCARDVNALIADWAGVRGWCPPIRTLRSGCSGRCSAWHGTCRYARPPWRWRARPPSSPPPAPGSPPSWLSAKHNAAARAAGRAALAGPGRAAARQAAAEAHARAVGRRTQDAAAETAARDAAIRAARGLPPT